MKMDRLILLGAVALFGLPPGAMTVQAAGEVSKEIIAVQIRKQGFECKNPLTAERDPAASKPDEAAWILKCEGVAYKVQLVPKQAAKVERLPDEPQDTQPKDAPPPQP
jgi:hypothetical protein